jgi:L-lactate dehydrogenase complex protein LldG
MPDERDTILSKVKGALAPLKERAAMPDYDEAMELARKRRDSGDPVAEFTARITAVNGEVAASPQALAERLRAKGWLHGYCDPVLWPGLREHFGEGFAVETAFDSSRIDDYQFGITRAMGAIAETGTIILGDLTTSSRLAALAPWSHVAVISRKDVHSDLIEAVARFGSDPNVVWCTGPSKTSDVEGILIEGVHGPGAQIALFVD